MSINTSVPATLSLSRTQAAVEASQEIIAERAAAVAALGNERATYAALLEERGGLGEEVRAWLAQEVLPALRSSGGYLIDNRFRASARSNDEGNRGAMMLPLLAQLSERMPPALR